MKTNKYKILVLSDLKDTTVSTLKSAVSFAKMIDGDIHVFYVKKPTEVVEKESQLSAMRTINQSYVATNKAIHKIIEPISKDYDIEITFNHAFGNLKNEISDYIDTFQPDVLVLGRRKSKPLSFLGDKIVDHVIKNFDGTILIASEENNLEPNKEISLGVLSSGTNTNMQFVDSLIKHTQKPLKSFKINDDQEQVSKGSSEKDTLEITFDKGDNAMKSISNYLQKSDINLLCVDRVNTSKPKPSASDIKNVINTINVSLLIS